MAKQPKPIKISGYILNIKLVSNERKTEDILIEAFEKLKRRKIKKKVSSDREAAIRTIFNSEVEGNKVAYGKISSAIDLGNDVWLNENNMEAENFNGVPEYMKAKLRDTEYILIPKAHRLFLKQSKDYVTPRQVVKFLNEALSDVIKTDEDIEIFIQKDKEGLTQILEANVVTKLHLEITKTNQDLTKDFAEYLDYSMGDGNIETISTTYIPRDKAEGLNIGTPIIKGSLDLVAGNGKATATIIDETGKSRIVKTDEYEKKYTVSLANEDSIITDIYNFIMRLWRP
jgi:hypothetical protein